MKYLENARKLRPIIEQAMQSVDVIITGNPVYNTLADLINLYVEVVQ